MDQMQIYWRGMPKKRRIIIALLCSVIASSCVAAKGNGPGPSSDFRVQADSNGKYWLIDPQGEPFLSIGINNIIAEPYQPKPNTDFYKPIPNQFNTVDEWKQEVFDILQTHGFNTLGSWSDGNLYDGPLYGTICLYVAGYAKDRCLEGLRPGFEDRVRKNVKLMLSKYPDIENVLGFYLDNEMPWYGHSAWGDISNYTLLESALMLPEEDPARQAAVAFLKHRYASVQEYSKAWGKPLAAWDDLTFEYARSCVNQKSNIDRQAFIEYAADAFYKTAAAAVRQMLPGKLILGTRFAGYAPEPVVRACGRYCDVISFNDYRPSPSADTDMLTRFWIWSGKKPLMITEYSWRAEENTSGNPNTGGGGAVVKTQAQRAENYKKYIEDLLAYPMVVGAHWFEFADQSPQGRFDGEDSNYGVVDIHHRPYTKLLSAMKQTNHRAKDIHAQSMRKPPATLPKPKAVVFEPGQYPDRPPFVDMLSCPIQKPELFHAPDAAIELQPQAGHSVLSIDTGNQWGCGILFFGPKLFQNARGPDHATDLGGYSAVEVDAAVGEHIVFDFFLDEAGVGPAGASAYDMSGGDDGESFVIPMTQGRGTRSIYRFELKDVEPRKERGNQKGAKKIDMNSIKGIALFFHGAQGKDEIEIFSLKLVR